MERINILVKALVEYTQDTPSASPGQLEAWASSAHRQLLGIDDQNLAQRLKNSHDADAARLAAEKLAIKNLNLETEQMQREQDLAKEREVSTQLEMKSVEASNRKKALEIKSQHLEQEILQRKVALQKEHLELQRMEREALEQRKSLANFMLDSEELEQDTHHRNGSGSGSYVSAEDIPME